jgi:tetratricopeptide (TPR) repeat protein
VQDLSEFLDEIETWTDVYQIRFALVDAVEVLRAHGYLEASRELAVERLNWFERRSPAEAATVEHRYWYGRLLFVAGRTDEAQKIFDDLVEESPEVIRRENLDVRATRAFIAAMRGDTGQALEDMAWLENRRAEDSSLERGIILGALGRRDEAIALLRVGARQHPFSWYQRIRVLFDPLRDHPDFQELIRPKG